MKHAGGHLHKSLWSVRVETSPSTPLERNGSNRPEGIPQNGSRAEGFESMTGGIWPTYDRGYLKKNMTEGIPQNGSRAHLGRNMTVISQCDNSSVAVVKCPLEPI